MFKINQNHLLDKAQLNINASVIQYIQGAYTYIKSSNIKTIIHIPGADSGGGAPGARPPKIGKNMNFYSEINKKNAKNQLKRKKK